jgi:cytoskeletal protein CcmA (bactofilin family)
MTVMFRRKEEGTEEAFQEAPTNVQVPPAPQGSETPVSTDSSAAANAAGGTFGSGFSASSNAAYNAKPAASGTPAAASAAASSASPYRAPGSTGAANVTDISNRNSRFGDSNRTSNTTPGSLGMDKNANKAASKNRILTVGNDILMKGEINSCDRIVIEGAVDATLKEVHTMEIAENGSFKGIAEVEEAEISGIVEGDLTVRGRLIIYSSGKVTGKITYGEIEIERGGQLQGEIKTGASTSNKAAKEAA